MGSRFLFGELQSEELQTLSVFRAASAEHRAWSRRGARSHVVLTRSGYICSPKCVAHAQWRALDHDQYALMGALQLMVRTDGEHVTRTTCRSLVGEGHVAKTGLILRATDLVIVQPRSPCLLIDRCFSAVHFRSTMSSVYSTRQKRRCTSQLLSHLKSDLVSSDAALST